MIIRETLNPNEPITQEELDMLKRAETMPITFDEDCPELTAEQLAQFRRVSEINRQERRKQTVTLRLSPQATKTAKSLGKGYTSVLSRILEAALADSDTIRRFL